MINFISFFESHEPKYKITKAKKAKSKKNQATLRLLDKVTPAIQASLIRGIRSFKNKVSFVKLIELARFGNATDAEIEALAPWNLMINDFKDLEVESQSAFLSGAELSKKWVPQVLQPKYRFDPVNPRISSWIKTNTGQNITLIGQETKNAVKQMVTETYRAGFTPRRAAELIRDHVTGLNEPQARALINFENKLRNEGLPEAKIRSMVNTESNKKLNYRLNMITRTETMNAINAGHQEMISQMAEEGLINPATSKKVWIISPGACEICTPMEGEVVGINESWLTPNGELVTIPSQIHPNCNCSMEIIPDILT